MKRLIISCLVVLCTFMVTSSTTINDTVHATPQEATIKLSKKELLEKKWGPTILAIATIESRQNPKAVSKSGTYVGYLQISPILVRECNRIAGYQKYTYNDRYDKQKSIDMFIDFQEHHNPTGSVEMAIRLWNSGDKNCMKRKASTQAYYNRVMSKFSASAQLK